MYASLLEKCKMYYMIFFRSTLWFITNCLVIILMISKLQWMSWNTTKIDLTIHFSHNDFVFVSNTYSCFVLSIGLKITLSSSLRTARNKFAQERLFAFTKWPRFHVNFFWYVRDRQRWDSHDGNIIFICPWHAKKVSMETRPFGKRE